MPIDLNRDDLVRSVVGVGYDRASPSLFVIEGLLGYLPRATTERVLTDLRAIATPSSRLAAAFPIAPKDRARVKRLRHRLRRMLVSALGEPWLTRFSAEEIDEVFAKTGWQVLIEADTPQRHEASPRCAPDWRASRSRVIHLYEPRTSTQTGGYGPP